MDDLISRQAAIDALIAESRNIDSRYLESERIIHEADAVEAISMLPSARPEIIRCKECKHSEHWYRDRRRCFLWAENGVSVFDDGFCNYAERRTDG